jgi:glyoxylase-like metal-dependent hydrolase (beta-lactamase superfamily II)
MMANLAAAGIAPTAIDTVVISHFHPDHIDGLKTKDGDKVFTNAEILVPEPEWTYWMDDAAMTKAPDRIKLYFRNARRIFGDIGKEVRRFKPGAEVAPGITSIPAFGHTPGHCAFAIASGRQSMLAMSDAVRNPYLFARHPEWQPLFDMDGPLAVKRESRCSTAPQPTACWSRPTTSRSRPAATSPGAAKATSSCRWSGSRFRALPKQAEASRRAGLPGPNNRQRTVSSCQPSARYRRSPPHGPGPASPSPQEPASPSPA